MKCVCAETEKCPIPRFRILWKQLSWKCCRDNRGSQHLLGEKKEGNERRGEKTGWKNVKEDRHRNSDENIAKQISIQVLWKTSDFVVDFDYHS